MNKRVLPAILSLIVLLGLIPAASGTAGTAADPVVTLGYLDSVFVPKVLSLAGQALDKSYKPLFDKHSAALTQKGYAGLATAVAGAYLKKNPAGSADGFAARPTPLTLKKGDRIVGGVGAGLVLRAGSAAFTGPAGGKLVNVTTGKEVTVGAPAVLNQYFLTADRGTGLVVQSDTATVTVDGYYRIFPAYTVRYTAQADKLKTLGLFLGTPTGYQLDRAATRLEALVIMIRLLGEEQAALAHSPVSPFADVPEWGRAYVAYAYEKGYTKGTSAVKFTPDATVKPGDFMTFVLRALGYSDTFGDFQWDKSMTFCVQSGLFSQSDMDAISKTFLRDQVVMISYKALSCRPKNASGTLLSQLVAKGAVNAVLAQSVLS